MIKKTTRLFLLVNCIVLFFVSSTAYAYKKGENGYPITMIQKMLNYTIGANLATDGKYGSGTERAVRNYQSSYNLNSTGEVNTETLETLITNYSFSLFNEGQIYRIKSYYYGCIDIPLESYNTNGTQLQLWEPVPYHKNQMYRFTKDGKYIRISSINGKVIEVRNSSTSIKESVAIWDDLENNLTKRWYFLPNPSDDGILLVNANSGLAMNVSGGVFQNGTKIWQYGFDNTISSIFYLEEISSDEYKNLGFEFNTPSNNTDTFEVFQQANAVNIKYASSNIKASGCGPTAMYNTFRWYGKDISLETIAKKSSSAYVKGLGTNNDKMLNLLQKAGWVNFNSNVRSKSEVISFLQNNSNSAVIFGLRNSFLKGKASSGYHVVSAVLTDGNNVFILDSSSSSSRFCVNSKRGYWVSMDELMKDSPNFRLITIN